MHRTRFNIVGVFLLFVALLGACSQPAVLSGPKFTGRLLLLAGDEANGSDLVELTAAPSGSTYNLSVLTKGVLEAAASPDRTRLLYATRTEISLRDLHAGDVKPLIKGESYCLAWAPDGKHFSYRQRVEGSPAKLYFSDMDGKTKLIWEDLVADQNHGCAHWVAPDRLIFDRLLGAQKKSAEAIKPNTTTMAILGDGVKLIDIDRKWSIEAVCQAGPGAFLRSADQNELLIAKDLNNLKTVNPTSGPCSGCRFVGFAAESCVPFFIEDSSSTSSEVFYLNPTNWQRQRSTHIGQPFSVSARMLINSAARLMVAGDLPASLWLIDTETGDIKPFFPKAGEPMMSDGSLRNPRPVVWIEK